MSYRNRISTMLMVGAAGLLSYGSVASAAPQVYYELVSDCSTRDSNCGPRSENDGPGSEQMKGDWFVGPDGNPWVATVVMSAKDIPNRDQGPYQCRYYAWSIDPTNGPQKMVDGLLMTQNRGDRPCNHPDLVYAGGTDMLFTFGTNDDNQTNVKWYAQVIDATTGSPKGGRTRLSDGDGNGGNDAAGSTEMLLDANYALPTAYPKRFVSCYNDNGNNADCEVAEMQADGTVRNVAAIDNVIDPANIPRPIMTQISPDGKFAVVAAKGNQRPPEDGAYLRVIDVANPTANTGHGAGKVTGQQAIMRSNEGANLYANSPEIYAGPTPGTFWAMNITSHQNRDGHKGTSTLYSHVITFDANYNLQIQSTSQVGHYETHGSMCTSTHGPDGVQAGILVESAVTNSGPQVLTPLYYDGSQMKITEGSAKVTTPYTADSGYLANLYGNNPNTQGRDFVSCIGSIPNPGYGQATGWQSDVKSFIVTASYGMMNENDYKNSMFISFVPAYTPSQTLPPDDPGTPPPTGDNGGDNGDNGSGDGTPSDPSSPTTSGSAGGCSTGGTGSGASSMLLLLGACFIAIRRRRR